MPRHRTALDLSKQSALVPGIGQGSQPSTHSAQQIADPVQTRQDDFGIRGLAGSNPGRQGFEHGGAL